MAKSQDKPVGVKAIPEGKEPKEAGASTVEPAEIVVNTPKDIKPDKVLDLHPEVEAPQRDKPRQFVRVSNGKVAEIITERENIDEEFHPDIRKTFIEITDMEEPPALNDIHKSGKTFRKPDESDMPPDMRRMKAFHGGAKIKGHRFSVDPGSWQQLTDAASHVSMFQEFPGGAATFEVKSDPPMKFNDPAEFMSAVRSLSNWRHKWNDFVAGGGKGKAPNEELD